MKGEEEDGEKRVKENKKHKKDGGQRK